MGRFKSALFAASAAAILTAGVVSAQNADRRTIVTVSGPVSIPGATLPAGTYVFRLADSPANRHIVQIFDRDEAKLITTLLAVPAERNQAEGDPLITFKETPSDRPPAVRYWYYAGERNGNEFVYPKSQAMMIARASGESVSAVDSDATDIEGWKSGSVTKVSADTDAASTSQAATSGSQAGSTAASGSPAATTAPQGEQPRPTATPAPSTTAGGSASTPAASAQSAPRAGSASAPSANAQTEPSATATTSQPERPVGTSGRPARLPRTASELPIVALIGVLSIVAALGVRVARRSIA